MIPYQCPTCKKTLQIPEEFAGQIGTCNHCKARITVPTPAVVGLDFTPDPPKKFRAAPYLGIVAIVAVIAAALANKPEPVQDAPPARAPRPAAMPAPTSATKAQQPAPYIPPAPAPAFAPQVQNNAFAEPQDTTVYLSATGTKYHRADCRTLRGTANPVPLSQAQANYQACKVCNPPS